MKKNISFSQNFGNFLIGISLLGFVVTLYPVIAVYVLPHQAIQKIDTTNSIYIPKINASAPIILNVNPFNEKEYMEALKKGVAHAKNTALPKENGTVFLFAHSSYGMPWELTRINTIFLRLNELEKGDTIEITINGTPYTYKVEETKEVWPHEVNYLINTSKNQLILQTCTPIGTSLKRLLVFAKKS